jgi:hypothetical protein
VVALRDRYYRLRENVTRHGFKSWLLGFVCAIKGEGRWGHVWKEHQRTSIGSLDWVVVKCPRCQQTRQFQHDARPIKVDLWLTTPS